MICIVYLCCCLLRPIKNERRHFMSINLIQAKINNSYNLNIAFQTELKNKKDGICKDGMIFVIVLVPA